MNERMSRVAGHHVAEFVTAFDESLNVPLPAGACVVVARAWVVGSGSLGQMAWGKRRGANCAVWGRGARVEGGVAAGAAWVLHEGVVGERCC